MKSVTNSNREPFQVKRYGHDEGLRSSSVIVRTPGLSGDPPWPVSACRIPDGQRTLTTSAAVRVPRPKLMSDGATDGVEDEFSNCCRRLPARISARTPMALRLLTRDASRTCKEA